MAGLNFRLWDCDNQVMEYLNLIELEKAMEMLDSYASYFYYNYFEQYPPMISLEIVDKDGVNLWEGDLRMYHGKLYKLVKEGWRFTFQRNLVEFGENETIVIDEDVAWESSLIGSIYQNPDLLLNYEKS